MQAHKPIDESKLDKNKIRVLTQHMELIKSLDAWILVPDGKLMPNLKKLGKIVEQLYGISDSLKVFRGFGLYKTFLQNNMGLDKVKNLDVGYRFDYRVEKYPLSFSIDIEIANCFGECTLQTTLDKTKIDYLDLTDELNFLICKERNIPVFTQKEVIVFPDVSLDCEIVRYKKSILPHWARW